MDMSEFDESFAADAGCHPFRHHSPELQNPSEELEQNSSDSHDNYRPMRYNAMEKAITAEVEESVLGDTRARGPNLPGSSNDLKQIISEMKGRILMLERQVATSATSNDHADVFGNFPAEGSNSGSKDLFENSVNANHEQRPMIPQLLERTWFDFMNKHATEKCDYAIEILAEDPRYYHITKAVDKSDWKNSKYRTLKPGPGHEASPIPSWPGEETPNRIRINSQWILNVLADIDKTVDASGPIVMLRPFKFLVHYEDKIRDKLRKLDHDLEDSDTTAVKAPEAHAATSTLESAQRSYLKAPQDAEIMKVTFQHLQCVVEFIDRYIKPTMNRLGNSSSGKIKFKDLWYIFKPGDDIFMPLRGPRGPASFDAVVSTPEIFQDRYNMMWRVTGVGGGRPRLSLAPSRHTSFRKRNPFKVNAYYIDFDGRFFCPTTHTLSIMPFTGEREISTLDFFPVRFMERAHHSVSDHLNKGKIVFDNIAAAFTHYYYSGPTLTVQPCGCQMQKQPLSQEHVESEVIVDFRLTLQRNPSWRPEPTLWKAPPVDPSELQERFTVRYWSAGSKAKLENSEYDNVYDDHHIDRERALFFRNSEPIFSPVPSGWLSNESMVPEKDVLLLPGRAFAFVLRTRTFAPLWLWLLQPIKPQNDGLHNLQLRDQSFKNTIQALVRTHFLQKSAQQTSDFEYDVVRGKGKGLVFLLHGAPGVGKTFTAESVAAANGKPLFQITCGDLGLTPADVERALKEIFRYAQLWSCVLLLDECDIFLAQRTKNDIKRNALVAVFLRVLEFYSGVLFLTTNRVGTLDDAIKSRITWIAYYPPLDGQQTRNIWNLNMRLLEERNQGLEVDKEGIRKFAREHYRASAAKDSAWNGRQIQNAFKVATALAEWDAYSQEVQHQIDTRVSARQRPGHPRLLAKHFKTVASATQTFDSYLQEATGFNEAERAYNNMERADDYTVNDDTLDNTTIPAQRPGSTTMSATHSYSRDYDSLPHLQNGGRRTSNPNQRQHKGSLSSLSQLSYPSPASHSGRSSAQRTATGISLDSQMQSPRSPRLSMSHSFTNAAAAAVATPYLSPTSLKTQKNGRPRSSSNLALVRHDSDDFDHDDNDPATWSGSEGDANEPMVFNGDHDNDDAPWD